jgi:hypothetical protein
MEGATSFSHGVAFSAGANSQGDIIYQAFGTVSGQRYQVDFDAGIFGQRSSAPLQLRVEVLGSGTLINDVITPPEAGTYDPSKVAFQHYTYTFVADGPNTTLRFTSVGLGNGGADQILDTVAVTAIP